MRSFSSSCQMTLAPLTKCMSIVSTVEKTSDRRLATLFAEDCRMLAVCCCPQRCISAPCVFFGVDERFLFGLAIHARQHVHLSLSMIG